MLISLFFFIIFGVVGINFYKGHYYYCYYNHLESLNGFKEELLVDKWDCLNSGSDWLNKDANFDHLGEALTVLFTIS